MFSFDKKQVTISLKYLGGHPELPKQRTLTVYRCDDEIRFKEVVRPVIPVQTIKKITLSRFSQSTPKVLSKKDHPSEKQKKVLVITLDYNGLTVHMLFTGENMTAKYAQFLGLLRGNYKEYVRSETVST